MYEAGQGQEEIRMVGGAEEQKEEEGEEEEPGKISSAVTVFRFIMKQSYICALIAMMVRGARTRSHAGPNCCALRF